MVVGLKNRILKLKNDSNLPIPLHQMPYLSTQQSCFINTDRHENCLSLMYFL